VTGDWGELRGSDGKGWKFGLPGLHFPGGILQTVNQFGFRIDNQVRYLWGQKLLGGMCLFIVFVGVAALATAGSVVMLPHEVAILHIDLDLLTNHHHDHTLASFIVHNRVSFGGALISVGILYWRLVWGAMARREPWAWWAMLLSAGLGSGSFFSFLPHGYWDPLHAAGTLVIVITLCLGLIYTHNRTRVGESSLFHLMQQAWIDRSPERLLMSIWAGGTLLGGAMILFTGMFPVFVDEDLHYMQTATAELAEISPNLIPYIAHDRSGFGGALVAGGLAILALVWCTRHHDLAATRRWLTAVWIIGAATAIGVHPLVGYTSISHLLPFLIKDVAFLCALIVAFTNERKRSSNDSR
jgi:hypothetical protein